MKYLILLFFITAFLGILFFEKKYSSQFSVDYSVSQAFTFPRFNQAPIWGDYPQKNYKRQVVHFWATWCLTCKTDLPELIEIIKNNQDAFFYLISIDSNMSLLKKTIAQVAPGTTNLCFIEGDWKLARSLNTTKIPESHIYNEEKEYLLKLVGSDIVSDKMTKILSSAN